jgi:hypothetical protein
MNPQTVVPWCPVESLCKDRAMWEDLVAAPYPGASHYKVKVLHEVTPRSPLVCSAHTALNFDAVQSPMCPPQAFLPGQASSPHPSTSLCWPCPVHPCITNSRDSACPGRDICRIKGSSGS